MSIRNLLYAQDSFVALTESVSPPSMSLAMRGPLAQSLPSGCGCSRSDTRERQRRVIRTIHDNHLAPFNDSHECIGSSVRESVPLHPGALNNGSELPIDWRRLIDRILPM